MQNFFKLVITAFSALLLAGCYAPENFNAQLDFNDDGSYTFYYKGDIAYVPLMVELQKKNMSTDKEKQVAQDHLAKIKKDGNVKSAEYIGKGRYKVEIEDKLNPGEKLNFMGFFSVVHAKDGSIKVSTSEVKQKDKGRLESLGLNVIGGLSVSVPKNAKVLSSNADNTPTLGFGNYKWNIKSLSDNANMVLAITK
jgi:hypothetical protein